jgi:hypothetical protein
MCVDYRALTWSVFGALLGALLGCDTRTVNTRVRHHTQSPAGGMPDAADGRYAPPPPPPTPTPTPTPRLDAPTSATPVDAPAAGSDNRDGPVKAPSTIGSACDLDDQCETGFCADGICCNVACRGTCVSCNLPGREGECVPVSAGQPDPRSGCTAEPVGSCGTSGFCNGQGGCAKYPPGTACGSNTCTGPHTFLPAGECDGDGTCVAGAALECTPFSCVTGSCRYSCVQNADCVPPNECIQGRCGLRGNGQSCTSDDQCSTGFCVDGVCCENECSGRCQFCASPNSRGLCENVRMGARDPRTAAGEEDPSLACQDEGAESCGDNGRCDGRGGCLQYEDGTVCRDERCETGSNAEFGESVCQDGSCRSPAGTSCAPYRGCRGSRCLDECSGDSRCISGLFCVDDTCRKLPLGEECDRGIDCVSGICAQGVCCNQTCNGSCRSCNLDDTEGTCTARTFSTEEDIETEQLKTGEIEFFNGGAPVPPGRYALRYIGGCIKYAAAQGWTVNATDQDGCCSFYLVGGNGEKKLVLPGTVGFIPGLGGHLTFGDCEDASQALPPVIYDHPGGSLGIFLQDIDYSDNQPGEREFNPSWTLSGTLTCP